MTWLAVLVVAAVSLLFRVSMLFRPPTVVTPRIDRSLSAMGPAVIASLITADIVGGSTASENAVYVIACAVALVVTKRTGNLLYGTGGAMAIVWFSLLVGF